MTLSSFFWIALQIMKPHQEDPLNFQQPPKNSEVPLSEEEGEKDIPGGFWESGATAITLVLIPAPHSLLPASVSFLNNVSLRIPSY